MVDTSSNTDQLLICTIIEFLGLPSDLEIKVEVVEADTIDEEGNYFGEAELTEDLTTTKIKIAKGQQLSTYVGTLLHELLHVQLQRLRRLVLIAGEELGDTASSILNKVYTDAEEDVVSQLESGLLPLVLAELKNRGI